MEARIRNQALQAIRIASPFVLRSVTPPVGELVGRTLRSLHRLGKQLVFEFEGEYFLVIHLMIAGRFQWKPPRAPVPGKVGLAAFDFASGTLILTEAGSKRRASIRAVRGREALSAFDRKA